MAARTACIWVTRPATSEVFTARTSAQVVPVFSGRADGLVLGNLDARRDWGWAPEYVDPMVRMAEPGAGGDDVVATGVSHTVADFIGAALARVGIDDWHTTWSRPSRRSCGRSTPSSWGDPSRAR